MSNPSIFPNTGPEDNADDLFIVDAQADDRERRAAEVSALPVVLDDETDEEGEYRREAIDLDDLDSGSGRQPLDLSSLIGQFGAKRQRSVLPPSQSPNIPATQPLRRRPVSESGDDSQIAALNAEIQRLSGELEKERNTSRRHMADLVNYRRKAENDRERAVKDSIERFVKRLLNVMDDFERSIKTTSETQSYAQLADGVQAILRNYETLLSSYAIVPIDTNAKLFDVELHEAVGTDPDIDLPEDTIVEELRRGYTIDGRLLRASMVKVARKINDTPPVNLDEQEETDSVTVEQAELDATTPSTDDAAVQ